MTSSKSQGDGKKQASRQNLSALNEVTLVEIARHQLPHSSLAYEELMRRHSPALLAFCKNTCQNESDAEDALQETLLRAFHNLHNFRGDASIKTWLFRIAYNESINQFRKTKPASDIDELEEPLEAEPRQDFSGTGFNQVLRHLDETDRSIVSLRITADLEFKDIAHITQSGLSAVKMRYQRALEKLAHHLSV